MRKFWKLTTVTGVAIVVATTVALGPAVAITGPPTAPQGYGFDNKPDLIVGGGSDTTAKAMLLLTNLYDSNGINNGCQHKTTNDATQNQCDGTTDKPYVQGNWDGDTVGEANPTGSGAGRNSLENLGGVQTYAGTANTLTNTVRTDTDGVGGVTVTLTGGSATVTDTAILPGDRGKLITSSDPNLPKPVYVGSVSGNTFTLSATADPTVDKPDPYLGVGTSAAGVALNISRYGCIHSGTSPGPVPDFGRSSSTPGSTADCSTETFGTTFWGFGQDQVEVIGFNAHGAKLNALTGGSLSATQLENIWGCKNGSGAGGRMLWSDLGTAFAGDNNPIVPWKMNTGSGTYNTFKAFLGGQDPNSGSCTVGLGGTTTGTPPLENDVKPWFNSITSGFGTGSLDPENWMGWGSFGVFSAFPFTSGVTKNATFYQATASAVGSGPNSFLPSTSLSSQYPISRVLWNVTRKGDADCPGVVTAGTRVCDFVGQPGPTVGATTDLNVTGATSGPGGAVREFMRFLCRGSAAQQGVDPFTGINEFLAETAAINSVGFTVLPTASRTAGTRCQVKT